MATQDTTKSSSWATKLSQKLKRRSASMTRKSGDMQDDESTPSSSQNPFARNYVSSTNKSSAASRGPSVEETRSPTTGAYGRQTMVSNRGASIEQDRSAQTNNSTTSGPSMYPVSRPLTSGSTVRPVQDEDDDDYIGLDMRGKARRRSSATQSRPGSSRAGGSSNPFSRNNASDEQFGRRSYDRSGFKSANRSRRSSNAAAEQMIPQQPAHARDYIAPPPGQLIRKSQDGGHTRNPSDGKRMSLMSSLNPFGRKSGDYYDNAAVEQTASNSEGSQDPFARDYVAPSTTMQTTPIRRKDVPTSRDGAPITANHQASISHPPIAGTSTARGSSSNTAPLPIYAEFGNRNTTATSGSPLQHARDLLEHKDGKASIESSRAQQSGLESGMQGLGFHSPDSFASAKDHYFETKPGERCEDFSNQEHPTAEEVVERAKYNTVDTTVHERMAPAVTHETIQRKVHEITEERITRDFHHHHHIHRILPVHDVEILPAKHYRLVNGVQVEMRPEEVAQTRIDAWQSTVVPKIAH